MSFKTPEEALAWFDAHNSGRRVQKKLTNLEVHEVSAVERPAHGVSGWVVAKSAPAPAPAPVHRHNPAYGYLNESEARNAALFYGIDSNTLRKSAITEIENGVIGRDRCGCMYLSTPETLAKAEGEAAWETYESQQPRAWSDSLTREQIDYLKTPPAANLTGSLIDEKVMGLDPLSRPDLP